MSSDEIILRPSVMSETEAREASRMMQGKLLGLWWMAVFGVLFVGAGGYVLFATGDWLSGIGSISIGLVILTGFGRMVLQFRPMRIVETRFAITDQGLRVEDAIDGCSAQSMTKWGKVLGVDETVDAVVLHLTDGGTRRIPADCFESQEQRALLLARARGART